MRLASFPYRAAARWAAISVVSITSLFVSAPGASALPAGSLDLTFADHGQRTFLIGDQDANMSVTHVAVQSDGKILLLAEEDSGVFLVRLHPDGTMDASFSGDGMTLLQPNGFSTARPGGVAVASDGKIVVAGDVNIGSGNTAFYAMRLLSNGTFDTTFDGDGVALVNPTSGYDWAGAMMLDADDKVLIAGVGSDFVVARLGTSGTPDTGFDGDGLSAADFGAPYAYASAIAVGPGGSIVVAGTYTASGNYQAAIARYSGDGTLDAGFDTDGMALIGLGVEDDKPVGVAALSDGSILVAEDYDSDGAVFKLLADGAPDTAFGNNGSRIFDLGRDSTDSIHGFQLQSDGSMLAYGDAGNSVPSVTRLTSGGALDSSFGAGGTALLEEGSAAGLALQPDGRIVIGGEGCVFHSNYCQSGLYAARLLDVALPDSSLTINAPTRAAMGSKVKVSGALSSTEPTCVNARTVELWKDGSLTSSKVVGPGGTYVFNAKLVKGRMRVQTRVNATHDCAQGTSSVKTVRAR